MRVIDGYTEMGEVEPYKHLAMAIVEQACKDYVGFLVGRPVPKIHYESAVKFLDDNNIWYNALCDISAAYLVDRLDKDIVEREVRRRCRRRKA